jgi:hypothetical protein
MKPVTIVITPRDRYSGVLECIETVYRCTPPPFNLLVLDLGYPRSLAQSIRTALADRDGAEFVPLGRMIPMDAFERIRERIRTPYTVFLDNDSRVTEGWLPPLLETGRGGAALVSPLTLEREGLDGGAPLRNHIYTSELRVVEVEGTPYLIEYKPYRRALRDEIPQQVAPTDMFELHCVMMETAVLQALDMPKMVVREHIDIGMQIHAMGRRLVAQPRSVVIFDNLKQRMTRDDIRFFFYRWSTPLATGSQRLFQERWGYEFLSKQSMLNWIYRRKVYLLARYVGLPSGLSNKLANGMKKVFCREWAPLKDPIARSQRLYETLPGGVPVRRDRIAQRQPGGAVARSPAA